jgi:hypothetical protein
VLFEDRLLLRSLFKTRELYKKDVTSIELKDETNSSGHRFSFIALRTTGGKQVKITFLYGSIPEIYLTLRAWLAHTSQKKNSEIRDTYAMKNASIRSMRILHSVFLAAIVGYIYVAERFFGHTKEVPARVVGSFLIAAVTAIVVALFYRRRFLRSAIDALRRDGSDATALVQWRAANTLSLVLAMSVSLDGVALRAMGSGREIAWLTFLVSIILMLLWTPRLDRVIGTNASPPPQA